MTNQQPSTNQSATIYQPINNHLLTCMILLIKNGSQQITNVPMIIPIVKTALYSRLLQSKALDPGIEALLKIPSLFCILLRCLIAAKKVSRFFL